MAKKERSSEGRRQFLLTATRSIGPEIRKRNQGLVDVAAKPAKRRYVVTDRGQIELWNGQLVVHGAVLTQRGL